jgi:hypothetical protein
VDRKNSCDAKPMHPSQNCQRIIQHQQLKLMICIHSANKNSWELQFGDYGRLGIIRSSCDPKSSNHSTSVRERKVCGLNKSISSDFEIANEISFYFILYSSLIDFFL